MLAPRGGPHPAERGQYDEALDWYRRALPLAPESETRTCASPLLRDGPRFERRGSARPGAVVLPHCSLLAKKIFDADYLISSMEQLGHSRSSRATPSSQALLKEAFAMNEGLLTSRRRRAHRRTDGV